MCRGTVMWAVSVAVMAVMVAAAESEAHGELWAVLVAGSNGWYNYRHQSDVCHAYQILHEHGVPDDHIIVMMYDDIANNTDNPHPGVIINQPGGPNVYQGVPKDYTGDTVTPQNFLKVLSGDEEAMKGVGSGRVVKSGPKDRIFLNMVDHGAPGLFAFPDDILNATDLIDTVLAMHNDKKFAQMVMYVESCESGSLFQGLLPHDAKIYAVSASGPHQHSYACYMDDELGTYLGDVFSVKWMQDTDRENLHRETLKQQYKLVQKATTTSHVRHWGQIHMDRQHLAKFLGGKNVHKAGKSIHPTTTDYDDPCLDSAVASPDVPVGVLNARRRAAKDPVVRRQLKRALRHLYERRRFIKSTLGRVLAHLTSNSTAKMAQLVGQEAQVRPITQWPCYTAAVRSFHTRCFHLSKNPYGLRVLQPLVNLCEVGYTADQFAEAAAAVCTHHPVSGIV